MGDGEIESLQRCPGLGYGQHGDVEAGRWRSHDLAIGNPR